MKPSDYFTPRRVLYLAVIAILALAIQAVAENVVGEHRATAAICILMWVLLVVDVKIVPLGISFVRPFLPGFTWIDLLLFLPMYAAGALAAYNIDQFADRRTFMIAFIIALPLFFVIGIACLFRLPHWRGPK